MVIRLLGLVVSGLCFLESLGAVLVRGAGAKLVLNLFGLLLLGGGRLGELGFGQVNFMNLVLVPFCQVNTWVLIFMWLRLFFLVDLWFVLIQVLRSSFGLLVIQ